VARFHPEWRSLHHLSTGPQAFSQPEQSRQKKKKRRSIKIERERQATAGGLLPALQEKGVKREGGEEG